MERKQYIDVLRSIAILFMIEVHTSAQLAPSNISEESLIALIVASIGGLAAPLFVTLSGWGTQHSLIHKSSNNDLEKSIAYWATSRFLFLIGCQLIVNLIAGHVFNWYTPGVLSLLALCTLLAVPLSKIKLKTKIWFLLFVSFTPIINSHFFNLNGDWSHIISANSTFEWLDRMIFSGTYPLFPWLSFFLLGGIIRDSEKLLNYKLMNFGILFSISFILYSILTNTKWATTTGDAMLTFFPASIAFIITANTTVLILFMLLQKFESVLKRSKIMKGFSKIGNLSLTIYILHFIPLRLLDIFNLNEWTLLEAIIITLFFTFIWWPLSLIHNKSFKKYSFESLLRLVSAKKNIPSTSVRES